MGEYGSSSLARERIEARTVRVTPDNLLTCVMRPEQCAIDPALIGYLDYARPLDFPMTRGDAARFTRTRATIDSENIRARGMRAASAGRSERQRAMTEDEEEQRRNALLLEHILPVMHEANAWFGEGAHLERAHPFDDLFHKTDLVLTIEQGGNIVSCAIDVTVTRSPEVLREKLLDIRDALQRQQMTTLSYARDPHTDARTTLTDVPRVIWAFAPEETFDDLRTAAASYFGLHSRAERRVVHGDVARSAIPYALLDITAYQLRAQHSLLKRTRGDSPRTRALGGRLTALLHEVEQRRDARFAYGRREPDAIQTRLRTQATFA